VLGLELSAVALGLAFLAGLLTTLSPCVLPILPMIAAAATGRHPLGLVALAAGIAFAFTAVGVAVAAGGQLVGLDERHLRTGAGALMAVVGLMLISTRLQAGFTSLAGANFPAFNKQTKNLCSMMCGGSHIWRPICRSIPNSSNEH
jgi:cytochrome c-type biogenesis protein